MKVKTCYLFAALIILVVSINLSLAQELEDTDANRQIVAQSTFQSFKTVKDNFGKKFAQSYFVVQVDIRNEKLDKQFIVQTIDVIVDPNQCRYAKQIYEEFNATECKALFEKYFYFLNPQQGTSRQEVIGTGKADLNRSNRNVGFRLLAFTANMGTVLTGFKGLIGRDGILGINVLGTTVTAAANTLFPNTANEKLDNLRNALPTEDVIIKSKESRTFTIFIPTERMFWKESWKEYVRSAKDSTFDTYKLKVVLDLVLVSSATGVLVANDAPKVQVKSDDDLRRQTKKFNLVNEATQDDLDKTDKFSATMELLQKNLANAATKDPATTSLRSIVAELGKVPRFKTFLDGLAEKITNESKGEYILQQVKNLQRSLEDEVLETKLMEIVINLGKQ